MAAGRTTGSQPTQGNGRRRAAARVATAVLIALLATAAGCINQPAILPLVGQRAIDRKLVEYPSNFVLTPLVQGLNCPTALCFDRERGDLIVAESGADGAEPHIFGFHLADGKRFNIYPFTRTVSFYPTGFVIYGPVGGMVVWHGRIYVSHRDRDGLGVITAFGRDGSHATVVADLPAQGDYGVTDLCVANLGGRTRLYFGVGAATNSGVVGLDNYPWVRQHPEVCDRVYNFAVPSVPIKLYGSRFDATNPQAGLGQPDLKVTGAFQPFGQSNQSRIYLAAVPNGSVCSVGLDDGGDLSVYAIGLHNPRGLATDGNYLLATNDGMQLRGTRPIANDPDSLIHVSLRGNYMAPDYTTDGHPVTDTQYAPPVSFLTPHGYNELAPLVDAAASNVHPANFGDNVKAVFPSLSGAAKMDVVPATGPFAHLHGGFVVALDGDRAPYASGGLKLTGAVGGKVVFVDEDFRVSDFVFNTARVPASRQGYDVTALERPCDVKFGPDGNLYLLDFGQMENESVTPRYHNGTGAIFKLAPVKGSGG